MSRSNITAYNFLRESRHLPHNVPSWVASGALDLFELTDELSDWTLYETDRKLKERTDKFLKKLNKWVDLGFPNHISLSGLEEEDMEGLCSEEDEEEDQLNGRPPGGKNKPRTDYRDIVPQPRIPDVFAIVRQYLLWDGCKIVKNWTKAQAEKEEIVSLRKISAFIATIRRALLSEKINKNSFAYQVIEDIQRKLIKFHNDPKSINKFFEMPTSVKADYLLMLENKSKHLWPSIPLLKRYIGIGGKSEVKEKAKKLLWQMEQSLKDKKISSTDPRYNEVKAAVKTLTSYISSKGKVLPVEETALHGIEELLGPDFSAENFLQGGNEEI
jgi:ribosomal protein S18